METAVDAQTTDFLRSASLWSTSRLVDWGRIGVAGVAAGCLDHSKVVESGLLDATLSREEVDAREFLVWLAQVFHWHSDTDLLTVVNFINSTGEERDVLLAEAWDAIADDDDVQWIEDGVPRLLHVWDHVQSNGPAWFKAAAVGLEAEMWTTRASELAQIGALCRVALGSNASDETDGLLRRLLDMRLPGGEERFDESADQAQREFAELKAALERAQARGAPAADRFSRPGITLHLPSSVQEYRQTPRIEIDALRVLLGLEYSEPQRTGIDQVFSPAQLSELDRLIEIGALDSSSRRSMLAEAARELVSTWASPSAARSRRYTSVDDWLALRSELGSSAHRFNQQRIYFAVSTSASMSPHLGDALGSLDGVVAALQNDPLLGRRTQLSLFAFGRDVATGFDSRLARDIPWIPHIEPTGGPNQFGPLVDHLLRRTAADIELPGGQLASLRRPIVVLLTAGDPADERWVPAFRSLQERSLVVLIDYGESAAELAVVVSGGSGVVLRRSGDSGRVERDVLDAISRSRHP